LVSIAGNVLVLCAVKRDRTLQLPANYLICSLAVTDLLVAGLVMPISAIYQVSLKFSFSRQVSAHAQIFTLKQALQ